MIKQVQPKQAQEEAAQGRALLVDVREPGEHASERVEGAVLAPLSIFEHAAQTLERGRPLLLLCARGARAQNCAQRLADMGFEDVSVVSGGLAAWKAQGLPVVRGERRVWALDRQVRFLAGLLILGGFALGHWLEPAFYAVPVFIGAGLTFSGLTDFCGMAYVLARMPWNKGQAGSGGCGGAPAA